MFKEVKIYFLFGVAIYIGTASSLARANSSNYANYSFVKFGAVILRN